MPQQRLPETMRLRVRTYADTLNQYDPSTAEIITAVIADLDAADAEIASLRKALPNPDKLELLASWLDIRFPDDQNPEIQRDLREWAKAIREVQP